jgi:hypothetical protein
MSIASASPNEVVGAASIELGTRKLPKNPIAYRKVAKKTA